ncbi:MAG: response regulator [Blautia sp.]|nr:response regulator [Blautia sp.]
MNILIVDDNIATLDTLGSSIDWKELGIREVFTAQSADEALTVVESRRVDILLCDIEMPGTDGLTLVRQLRGGGNQVVCLFLTAHAEFDYAQQAIELNSLDYILKPFTPQRVTEKLRRAIQVSREQAENSSYIKYGKLWVSSQEPLPDHAREKLVQAENEDEHRGVQMAKDYIQEHYTEQISIADIASYCSYNPSYLSTIFKQHEGIPPLDYLTNVRIRQARLLLACHDFSIGDVATMVGFQSISYFNRTFKKIVGQTPGDYRRKKNNSKA